MQKCGRRFDPYLASILANELKRMAGLWVKASKLCKDETTAAIREGLKEPGRVRQALTKLKPSWRTALAFIKEAGGEMEPDCLEAAMVAAGYPAPREVQVYSHRHHPWCHQVIDRGVALVTGGRDPTATSGYCRDRLRIFSDGRLLKEVAEPEIVALDIEADLVVKDGIYRPQGSVMLDIVAVLQAIDGMGGVGFTQAGLPRVSDIRKLRRVLQWSDDMKVDGIRFPNPTEAMVVVLRAAGLLDGSPSDMRLAEPLKRFVARSQADQVRPFVHGFASARGWVESGWLGKDSDSWRYDGYPRVRHALVTALRALPAGQPGFFALDRFDEAVFERVCESVSLESHVRGAAHTYGLSADERQRKEKEWRDELRTRWLARERPWIESAMTTWLYWLGIVELSFKGGAVQGFRLTELGRQVFHNEPATSPSWQTEVDSAGAWTVQPNFDLVVHVDKASPAQLAFIESIAERQGPTQRHVAHYVLTRDSTYRALESGLSVDKMLASLRKAAEQNVPDNVVAELRSWANRREQIVVRHYAKLLEFHDDAARRAAIAAGVKGLEVGERLLLVESGKGKAALASRKFEKKAPVRLDYTQPLPACVTVRETGLIRLSTADADLLIRGQLDVWGEREGDDAWQLTVKSVRAATQGGRSVDDLLDLLDSRAVKGVPVFLRIALQAWSGKSFSAQLGKVAVLRCPQPDVFRAIAGAKRHSGCLLGELGPDTFLVDAGKTKKLKQALGWAGIEIESEVTPR